VRGLFITGTDTGVGKTILSAALLAAMAADGETVRAYKPVVTGLDDQAEIAARGQWPADHELLAAVADMEPDDVAPLRYGPAVSPHLAAELAGEPIDPALLLAGAGRIGAGGGAQENGAGEGAFTIIVEGVGGLLTPLAEDYSVCDFAVALGLPVLIAARAGLGTINHTLLTLRVARSAGLDVRAVVLTPWPEEATELERSNRSTIGRLGEVAVEGLALVRNPHGTELARAGAEVLARLVGVGTRASQSGSPNTMSLWADRSR
jgi:dethiobiotin synthetase